MSEITPQEARLAIDTVLEIMSEVDAKRAAKQQAKSVESPQPAAQDEGSTEGSATAPSSDSDAILDRSETIPAQDAVEPPTGDKSAAKPEQKEKIILTVTTKISPEDLADAMRKKLDPEFLRRVVNALNEQQD